MTLLSLSYPGEHLTHEMRVVTVPASPEGVKILRDSLEHLAELKLRENLPLAPIGQVWSGSQVDQRGDSERVGGWGVPGLPSPSHFPSPSWGLTLSHAHSPPPTCAASPEMSPLVPTPTPHCFGGTSFPATSHAPRVTHSQLHRVVHSLHAPLHTVSQSFSHSFSPSFVSRSDTHHLLHPHTAPRPHPTLTHTWSLSGSPAGPLPHRSAHRRHTCLHTHTHTHTRTLTPVP